MWQELVRASWLAGVPLQAVLAQAPSQGASIWAEREYRTLSIVARGQELSLKLEDKS